MKNLLPTLLLSTLVLSAAAQTTVRGKVIDETGTEVIGANVYFSQDISSGVATDIDGQFELISSRTGADTVIVSYISYNTERIPVNLTAGVQSLGEILLAEEGVALADVVVVARKRTDSDMAMQTLERKSLNTVSAISSQAIQSRGDNDAASAVSRVTGVSVEGGKYVYVRGLSDRYSKSTLNGASIPGLDPNKNSVQMDLFPTNLIDNIVVYKNFTPNLPADFTGGLVDISTKDFPDQLTVKAAASVGLNANAHLKGDYLSHPGQSLDFLALGAKARSYDFDPNNLPSQVDLLRNPNLAADARAATLSLSNELVPQTTTPAPNHSLSFSIGDRKKLAGKTLGLIGGFTYNRNASGFSGGEQGRYKLTERGASRLNPLRNLSDNSFSDEVTFGALANASLKLNSLNRLSLNMMHNRNAQSTTRYQEGRVYDADHDLYQVRTLVYTERSLTSLQLRGSHALATNPDTWTLDYVVAGTRSQMDQPDLRFINNFIDFDANGQPERYVIEAAEDILPTRFSRSMTEDNLDAHFDIAKGFSQWGGLSAKLKFGGGYIYKDRSFRETTLRYANENAGNVNNFSQYVTPANAIGSDNGLNGIYIADFTQDGNQYDSQMGIGSAYVMSELPLTARIKSVFGLRGESTQLDFTSLRAANRLNDARLINTFDVLPSASFIYTTKSELMNVRLGYSRTLARPTFREVAPVSIYDEVLNAVILGDTTLQRTLVDNIDMRWEVYSESGDMFSLGAFYKRFSNPIELTINPQAINLELQYRNVAQADLLGAEFEFNKSLRTVIPGLSTGVNLTYVYSQVDIPSTELQSIQELDPESKSTRPMFGQSPYIVNGFINYRSEAGITANVTYNVQGQRLSLVSRGGTPNVFERPFNSLSAKLTFPVAKQLKLSVAAGNILDSNQRFTQRYNGSDYIFQQFKPGRTASLGLSWQLN